MNIIRIFKNHLKFVDTITTKLLMLVLFVTVIPLVAVGNFSTGIINQSMLDRAKNELNFCHLFSQQRYLESSNNLKLLVNQAKKGFLDSAYKKYLTDKNTTSLLQEINFFRNNAEFDVGILIDKNIIHNKYKFALIEKNNSSLAKLIKSSFEGNIISSSEVIQNINGFKSMGEGLLISKDSDVKGVYQTIATPFFNRENRPNAVFIAAKSLTNSNDIPNTIRTTTGASVNVYEIQEEIVEDIKSNLKLSEEKNSDKKTVNSEFMKFLRTDNVFYTRNQKQDDIEIGQYTPIKNFLGDIVGVMYVGISESKFTEPGVNNIKLISLISVLSLILSIVIAALFARTITTPILKLVIAAKSIASGYLDQRVQIKGNDEISQLSNNFNQMADNLRKQEQLRDNFVATLTHDLKVPMLAENQTINYLLKQAYGPLTEEQKEVLDLIKSTNNSSLEMVSTLLEVYRYDTGNTNLLKSEFDIVKLMRDSIDQIKSLAQDKKIMISLECKEDQIFITADEREIKRVLHNLIGNAITNGIHRGQIVCNIERQVESDVTYHPISNIDHYTTLKKPLNISNSVLISIKDDGIGIPREDMAELFKRFSLSNGKKPAGTGLGLYYSYQVVSKHKGEIWAESAEGQGTTFRFILPIL